MVLKSVYSTLPDIARRVHYRLARSEFSSCPVREHD